ncbi:MAG: gliding motility-associated protein GldE [Bacteroidales bacterium]|nr:gliding motility-associated protein GldE [Bacteroidales bacterium]
MEAEPYPLEFLSVFFIQLNSITPGIILGLITILILLFGSAMISGAEVAYFSMDPVDKDSFRKSESKTDKLILKHLNHPERLLATILVVNNFINVGIVIISTFVTQKVFDFSNHPVLGFLFQIVIITFLILFFGEILPKIYANQNRIKFSKLMARPLEIFDKIFWPVSAILVHAFKIVKKRVTKRKRNISINELSDALELGDSTIAEDRKILKGIVKFGNISVREIMKPRVDVMGVDIQINFTKLKAFIIESGYSRIPVYEESFDHINGILYIKDLLNHLNKPASFKWQTLIRPPYYVPETKMINDLLKEFQTNKIHLAIVVDEYGGTSGIVTLEDILEEIVGEITDEFDEEDLHFTKINDNNYLFEGKILLNDFYKVVHINDTFFDEVKGDADTLAGLILELRGEIPKKDDKLSYKNYVFKIKSVDDRRIKQIHLTIQKPENTNQS